VTPLLPIMGVVFIAYLVIGVAMPVLPLHVHHGLGLGTFVVGLVAGSQFAAALVARMWAGHLADSKGAKRGLVTGLLIAAAAGGFYLLSLHFAAPETSVAILLLGRALLGVAESVIITSALIWGVTLIGPQHTGKVMSWVGTALYAAFAVGAPVGTTLYDRQGFSAIAWTTTLLPVAALSLVVPLRRPVAPESHLRPSFIKVIRAVWLPGLGLAISGVGFGAVTTFIALLFAERGWNPVWLAFTAFSVAFILGRVVFGHLPDRIGGAKVALVCILIEAVGQTLIWRASGPMLAFVGVTFTGLGYSLVYPGLGVEALRSAPPENRGVAMGAYTAFLDLSLGLSSPVLGFIAGRTGLDSVFLVSTVAVLCSAAIPMRLMRIRAVR
jgi:predicted MFS family arabinose efflux permease